MIERLPGREVVAPKGWELSSPPKNRRHTGPAVAPCQRGALGSLAYRPFVVRRRDSCRSATAGRGGEGQGGYDVYGEAPRCREMALGGDGALGRDGASPSQTGPPLYVEDMVADLIALHECLRPAEAQAGIVLLDPGLIPRTDHEPQLGLTLLSRHRTHDFSCLRSEALPHRR